MDAPAPLTPAAFVTAGQAHFTIQSKRTGKHFTYRANARDKTRPVFVSVLTDHGYEFIGIILSDGFRPGLKSKIDRHAPSVQAFQWFWDHVHRLPDTREFKHEGRCCRCGRRLTTPESLATGIGPDCADKL